MEGGAATDVAGGDGGARAKAGGGDLRVEG
jgi:hypothetical protein